MKSDDVLKDIALLAVRVGVGASIAAHGAQKMFGAFGGAGIGGTSQFLSSLGFTPGEKFAKASCATEIASGVLITAGALGPVGPAMLASVMIVAAETVHRKNGYFQSKNGFELNAMYFLMALVLANVGPGSLSIDRALGLKDKLGATAGWTVFAGGILAAAAILGQRQNAPHTHVETGTIDPASVRDAAKEAQR
ncbi:MAG: DoxX family protein [Candidatus Eremiobacteraeota bacterium]|nr:DoxX family protein [Candidatus Eremiobacteraeota bacterium]